MEKERKIIRNKQTVRMSTGGNVPRKTIIKITRTSVPTISATIKKPHFRLGSVALRKMGCYEQSTKLRIAKALCQSLMEEIAENFKTDLHFQSSAIGALLEASEIYLVSLFEGIKL
uniref:Core Histone H2A/H2B/H3 domain-containing protein n=1 Tax=Glossina brevipalpis TaxID=37001 RepID=A0A1A9WDH6_9MUSC